LKLEDTIAAVSTPPGEGGIALIRVSGPEAVQLVSRFFQSSKGEDLTRGGSHTIHHGLWVDGEGKVIDEVLVSLFLKPHSYTGEDVVEISCHGGIRITRRILEVLTGQGARHAEPGEFTKRAFLNRKMDLMQAEAVCDLIRARSDASLEAAIRQLQGSLSKKIGRLKEGLMKIVAHFEASLDFPDERLEVYSHAEFLREIDGARKEVQGLLKSFQRGQILREGILTVIVGRPNVGKSSLLNALLEKDRALVSHLPGTTRDALEETIEIGGMAVRLVDTAGLSLDSKSELDQMGMERTRRYLQEGHLFLVLVDGSSEWSQEDEAILSRTTRKNYLVVINKIDLPARLDLEGLLRRIPGESPCFISCLKGDGLPELEKRIQEKIQEMGIVPESATLMRLRHKQALERALEAMERSRKALEKGESAEFILMDLKASIDSLQELIGEVYSEDLLDIIFQEFCIGK